MSADLYPTLGTFFPDGDAFTGIISTSVYQGRMELRPRGHADGRLDAVIGGHKVGYARPRFPIGQRMEYEVILDASLLPGRHRLVLLEQNGWYGLYWQD